MRIFTLAILFLMLAGSTAFAQAPSLINYQGIARNSSGAPLNATKLGMRLSIRTGTPSGAIVYQETQSPTTNAYGLFNVLIGAGTPVTGTIAGIAWGTGNKFIQVEVDPAGGSSYTNLGTTQLLSVPYALYAASGNATLTLTGSTLSAGANSITLPTSTYTAGTGINISSANVVSAQNTTALWNASQIQGYAVSTNAPSTGQILVWTGSAWVPNNPSTGSTFSGTTNFISKFTSSTSVGNSQIEDDGTSVGVAVPVLSSANKFQVNASGSVTAIAGLSGGSGSAVAGNVVGTGGGIAGYFSAGANGRSLIVPAGRVGIGLTNPSHPVEIKSSQKISLLAYTDTMIGIGSSFYYDTMPAAIKGEYRGIGENDGSGVLGLSIAPEATFGVGVTGMGNFYGVLGMGTDTGVSAIYAHAHGANYGLFVQGTSGAYAATHTQQSGATYALFADGTSYFNGAIMGVGSFSYSSDRKLKKDIQPISSALSTISRIKPASYRFRTGEFGGMNLPEGRHYGVIAQELREVLPELVSEQHYEPAHMGRGEAKEQGVDYLGVNYNELVPILIKGMQEQQAIIEQQQQALNALQKRIEALEQKK